ncbi:hypothetical protein QBC44DRAFT_367547 [Cladorrhinum sp. PSN332]|nr:hypothetical protein QBC44DRAFT_367547 [Cladorrhinum sp. PSN332]
MKHSIAVVAAIGLATAAIGNAASIPKRDPKVPPLGNIFNKNSPVTGALQNTAANVAGNLVGSLIAGEVANQVLSSQQQPAGQQQQEPPASVQRRRPIRGPGGNIGTHLIKGLANGAGSVLPAVLIGGVANQVLSNTQQPTQDPSTEDPSISSQNQRRQSAQPPTAEDAINQLLQLVQQTINNLPQGQVQKRQPQSGPVSDSACRQLASCASERFQLEGPFIDVTATPPVQAQPDVSVTDATDSGLVEARELQGELDDEEAQAIAVLLEQALNGLPAGSQAVQKREPRIPIGPIVSGIVKFFGKQAAQEAAGQAVDAVQAS